MRRLRALLIPSADGPQLVGAAPVVAVRTLLRRFWPDARPYRGRLALGLLLAALVPAIEAVEIYLFKLVVDDVLVPRELAALAPLAAAYVGLALASGVLSFADGYLAAWVGERFLLVLRTRVFAHVQGLSSHALDGRRLGDVLQRLTSDVQAIEAFVLSGLGDGVSALLRILFFGGALFLLSWQLALVSLVVAPLFFVLARHFSRLTRHAAREKRRRAGRSVRSRRSRWATPRSCRRSGARPTRSPASARRASGSSRPSSPPRGSAASSRRSST